MHNAFVSLQLKNRAKSRLQTKTQKVNLAIMEKPVLTSNTTTLPYCKLFRFSASYFRYHNHPDKSTGATPACAWALATGGVHCIVLLSPIFVSSSVSFILNGPFSSFLVLFCRIVFFFFLHSFSHLCLLCNLYAD